MGLLLLLLFIALLLPALLPLLFALGTLVVAVGRLLAGVLRLGRTAGPETTPQQANLSVREPKLTNHELHSGAAR
jgi:hypothetical protein